ncbi:MAG TPA: hypothetical protein VNS63_01150 [Blastocatellia bacterium]|nr:hypothetical protein [Blastocatellia bacterium]
MVRHLTFITTGTTSAAAALALVVGPMTMAALSTTAGASALRRPAWPSAPWTALVTIGVVAARIGGSRSHGPSCGFEFRSHRERTLQGDHRGGDPVLKLETHFKNWPDERADPAAGQ